MSNKEIDNSVPSNPKDRQKVKQMLAEMTHCYQRIDDEKEAAKDVAKTISEDFGIEKKLVNKLARTMYKHDYANVQAEHEHFEHLYEMLIEGKKSEEDDNND